MTGRQDLFDESLRLGHSAAWDLQWDRAIDFYRKALAEFPEHPTALTSLGLALLELGQLKESLAAYHRAAKASPSDPLPVEKCAEIFERLGQVREAVEQHEAAADLYVRRRDAEKALENWNHIARLVPGNLAARSRLALTLERIGRPREAAREYLAVSAILQQSGKVDPAVDSAQRALALVPGDPEASNALNLLRRGRPLPSPTRPRGATGPLRMARVQEFIKAETPPPAEGTRDEEVTDPEVAAQREALTILAGLLFEEPKGDGGSGGMSMTALTKGKSKGDDARGRPRMYLYLGQAIDLQTRGHKAQAAKELQHAIDDGLDHPAAHLNLGLLKKELKDYEGARKSLTAASGHPDLALGANLALGRLAKMKGDMPEAGGPRAAGNPAAGGGRPDRRDAGRPGNGSRDSSHEPHRRPPRHRPPDLRHGGSHAGPPERSHVSSAPPADWGNPAYDRSHRARAAEAHRSGRDLPHPRRKPAGCRHLRQDPYLCSGEHPRPGAIDRAPQPARPHRRRSPAIP